MKLTTNNEDDFDCFWTDGQCQVKIIEIIIFLFILNTYFNKFYNL
jgi:hypothetical protein